MGGRARRRRAAARAGADDRAALHHAQRARLRHRGAPPPPPQRRRPPPQRRRPRPRSWPCPSRRARPRPPRSFATGPQASTPTPRAAAAPCAWQATHLPGRSGLECYRRWCALARAEGGAAAEEAEAADEEAAEGEEAAEAFAAQTLLPAPDACLRSVDEKRRPPPLVGLWRRRATPAQPGRRGSHGGRTPLPFFGRCFCGTKRHLPSYGLHFNGVWLDCDCCGRRVHGDCAGGRRAVRRGGPQNGPQKSDSQAPRAPRLLLRAGRAVAPRATTQATTSRPPSRTGGAGTSARTARRTAAARPAARPAARRRRRRRSGSR